MKSEKKRQLNRVSDAADRRIGARVNVFRYQWLVLCVTRISFFILSGSYSVID